MAGLSLFVFALAAFSATAWDRYEKNYPARDDTHLTISNVYGDVSVETWQRRAISVRAKADPSVEIDDKKSDDKIEIYVKKSVRPGRADFNIAVPPDTSLYIKNVIGKVEIRGVKGHVRVESFDSDVRLIGVRAPSVEVRVTSGDIYFDGKLDEDGDYLLQSMKGDIDVILPASSAFKLRARALSENINLGGFLSDFKSLLKGSKEITGFFRDDDGPKLTLTAYAGRILFHQK
jgi:hypothetical protein